MCIIIIGIFKSIPILQGSISRLITGIFFFYYPVTKVLSHSSFSPIREFRGLQENKTKNKCTIFFVHSFKIHSLHWLHSPTSFVPSLLDLILCLCMCACGCVTDGVCSCAAGRRHWETYRDTLEKPIETLFRTKLRKERCCVWVFGLCGSVQHD